MGRKHSGKRRNRLLQAISPFPTVFSKDLYCRHVKIRACLGKGEPFTKPQNLGPVQIESNCRRQFQSGSNGSIFFNKVKNIVEKGENAVNQHFLLFPQCFQKASFQALLKIMIGSMVKEPSNFV